MHRVMQENLSWRGARHPWLEIHPSAGSIFKKIEGVGAGRLIDQCGLKGLRIGDAQISHIHANIMVNLGHATAPMCARSSIMRRTRARALRPAPRGGDRIRRRILSDRWRTKSLAQARRRTAIVRGDRSPSRHRR